LWNENKTAQKAQKEGEMDYRTKDFKDKFESASKYLNVKSTQIMSLKFRDRPFRDPFMMRDYHDNLLKPIAGDFQGKGYLTPEGSIIVEHESGFEIILSDIGSFASIISFGIALYLLGRDRRTGPMNKSEIEIERRYFDKKGVLIEEKVTYTEIEDIMKKEIARPYEDKIKALKGKIKRLEEEIKNDDLSKNGKNSKQTKKSEPMEKGKTKTKKK
jgi:hypothetical protein